MGANPANFSQGQQIANPIYIVDTSGNQIASFGGGTQYTTGNATPASPIGTLPVFDNAGTIAKVSLAVGLPVNIVGGGGSGGTALADNAAFTAGTTTFTPSGGVYNDAVAAATSGNADTVRITSARAFHTNLRNASGTEIGTASNPVQVSLANTASNSTNVNVAVNAALPAGTNVIGHTITDSGSVTQLAAGTNVIGSTTIQATSGTALVADQSNTELRTSVYGKNASAGDTPLLLTSSGAAQVSQVASQSVSGTLQSAQNAAANGSTLSVLGMSVATWTVNMSGFTGTVNFEGSEDGTNYSGITTVQLGTNTLSTTTAGTTATSITVFESSVGGLQLIRARTSSVSAGTVTVTAHAVPVPFGPRVVNVSNANANGQTTMVNSAPVVIASDQTPFRTSTGTKSNVASSASSVTILASNSNRKKAMIYNDSTQVLYLDLTGGTAANTSYTVQIPSQGSWLEGDQPIYTGAITGIWAAANGNARVTEWT